MDNVLAAFMAGGGMGAAALVVQKLMERATTRQANEIAEARLEMEMRDSERKTEAARRAEIVAEADRFRRLLSAEEESHEKTRGELESMRLNCRRHGDLCQIDMRTKEKIGTE